MIDKFAEDECVAVAEDAERRCIHCHRCQKHCVFLAKYAMDIGNVTPLNEHRASCGFGGGAARFESALAHGLAEDVIKQCQADNLDGTDANVLVYCASCGNALGRSGHRARHVLSLMMGVDESADISRSFVNRVRSAFI